MMTRKSYIAVVALLVLALAGSHFSKLRLDEIRPNNEFREMLYLPSGTELKVLACGFDAPLADFLWVKGQLYFSDNLRALKNRHEQNARYRYVYKLHDVITDLSPRFGRAYTLGALYLLVTGKEHHARDAIKLLKKGIAASDRAARDGKPLEPDERWYMHLLIANTYDQNLDDLASSLAHYRLAAKQPGCPPEVYAIIVGVEQQQMLGAGAIERYDVMIRAWESQLKSLRQRGAVDDTLQNNIRSRLAKLVERRNDLVATRELEKLLSEAGKLFIEKTGRAATSLRQLYTAGLLKGDIKPPLHKKNDYDNSPGISSAATGRKGEKLHPRAGGGGLLAATAVRLRPPVLHPPQQPLSRQSRTTGIDRNS